MNSVRRIASELLGVGQSKVRFKPDASSKISEALTREDVRALIADGSVYFLKPRGVSRLRGRQKQEAARKGRRGGAGSRKGTHSARLDSKLVWIAKVRAQRRYLRGLVEQNKIQGKAARKIYMMVKGNAFKGVKILETYLKDNKLLK
jgi:large subunit ribosomal protein L19e